jgi:hypothetical protein
MKKPSMALRQPDDSEEMTNAIAWLVAQGLPVRRVSIHQVKVGPWNLYPDRGSFNRDDMPAKREGGFEAFQEQVAFWWRRKNAPYGKTLAELV